MMRVPFAEPAKLVKAGTQGGASFHHVSLRFHPSDDASPGTPGRPWPTFFRLLCRLVDACYLGRVSQIRLRYMLLLISFLFLVLLPPVNDRSLAGQRRPKRAEQRSQSKPATIDYSRFSHGTKKHQEACNTCHKVPTDNWKTARDFPDIADYPGHDACVSCHRRQFFKGAKPAICSICHSKVSPRDDARFAFRNPRSPRQFMIEFPHDKHQDVIARMFQRFPAEDRWRFLRASFTYSSLTADDKTKHYNNCEICHGPRSTVPVAPTTGWIDGFVPDAATFKAAPTSHAACFNCHWKSQQPTNDNCAGCHKLTGKPYELYGALYVPKRFSLKFRHAREQHVQECTTCHINITKANTLRGLQPDVPITSCTECHNKDGLRLDVSRELEAIDRNRDFVCGYCHTSDVGRREPPTGHYLISGREPMMRKDVK